LRLDLAVDAGDGQHDDAKRTNQTHNDLGRIGLNQPKAKRRPLQLRRERSAEE